MVNTIESGHERTIEVGKYPANPWGLFDMLGNVWEWVEDHWHFDYKRAPSDGRAWVNRGRASPRVLRGGCWNGVRGLARSANRHGVDPYAKSHLFGFRVVCSSPS